MLDNWVDKVPILGHRETIAQITPETLAACHKAFYRPDNMLLCVVGDVEAETVTAIAQEVLGDPVQPPVTRVRSWEEAMTCPKDYAEKAMDVAMPTFHLGFKCEAFQPGEEAVRREITAELMESQAELLVLLVAGVLRNLNIFCRIF